MGERWSRRSGVATSVGRYVGVVTEMCHRLIAWYVEGVVGGIPRWRSDQLDGVLFGYVQQTSLRLAEGESSKIYHDEVLNKSATAKQRSSRRRALQRHSRFSCPEIFVSICTQLGGSVCRSVGCWRQPAHNKESTCEALHVETGSFLLAFHPSNSFNSRLDSAAPQLLPLHFPPSWAPRESSPSLNDETTVLSPVASGTEGRPPSSFTSVL